MMEYKLGTISLNSTPVPAMLVAGQVVPIKALNGISKKIPDALIEIIADMDTWHPILSVAAETVGQHQGADPEKVTYCAPIVNPKNLICIGVNYRDHLAEMKVTTLPDYPYGFLRPSNCLTSHNSVITLPDQNLASQIDWEAELGIVIGRRIKSGNSENLLRRAVAGYTVINDISARDWIKNRPHVGIDWVMQKAWDNFQPTGPWITPAVFVPDPQNLALSLRVNGEIMQDSNTNQMIFGVEDILRHLSSIMTLEPGDIIATGTPAGVGFGMAPQNFIQRGDTVTVEVEGLGILENQFN